LLVERAISSISVRFGHRSSERSPGVNGRQTAKKAIVAIAVEVREPRGTAAPTRRGPDKRGRGRA
jgi:hypothetical protein